MSHKQPIPGLTLKLDAIDYKTETALIQHIEEGKWTSAYNTTLKRKNREVQQYGHIYNYQSRGLSGYVQIPNWLYNIAEQLLLPKPDNVIINKYEPGEGITAHTDSNCFGPIIASLSLNSPITMVLKFHKDIHEYALEPRSLLKLEDIARYKYTHEIPARKSDNGVKRQKRYSITFRTVV